MNFAFELKSLLLVILFYKASLLNIINYITLFFGSTISYITIFFLFIFWSKMLQYITSGTNQPPWAFSFATPSIIDMGWWAHSIIDQKKNAGPWY